MSGNPTTTEEKVSRNAMLVLFAMVSLMGFMVAAFVYVLVNVNYASFAGESGLKDFGIIVGVFTTAIATTGTLAATLIQQLWGK